MKKCCRAYSLLILFFLLLFGSEIPFAAAGEEESVVDQARQGDLLGAVITYKASMTRPQRTGLSRSNNSRLRSYDWDCDWATRMSGTWLLVSLGEEVTPPESWCLMRPYGPTSPCSAGPRPTPWVIWRRLMRSGCCVGSITQTQ